MILRGVQMLAKQCIE